jgi:hypothetical protein
MMDEFTKAGLKIVEWRRTWNGDIEKRSYELSCLVDALVAAAPDPADELLAAVDELMSHKHVEAGERWVFINAEKWNRFGEAYDAYRRSLEGE